MKKIRFLYIILLMIMSLTIVCSCSGDKSQQGEQGIPREPGKDGKSAYELYLESHPEYTKSEQEWLEDLINGNLGESLEHKVTLNYNNGTSSKEIYVKHSYKIDMPVDPVKEGYTFIGWFYNENKWNFDIYPVLSDMTLEAVYAKEEPSNEPEGKQYTVTYVTNGKESSIIVKEGEKASKPADPVQEGYIFKGWFVGEEEYNFEKEVTNDLELVAKFEEDNIKPERIEIFGSTTATVGYTVTFNATVYPAQTNQNVKWESIDESLLIIDQETGVGVALKTGIARIKAYSTVDGSVQSNIFTVEIKEEVINVIPDMQGYKIVIMNASSTLIDFDPFLDGYTQSDKIYKQRAWREVEKDFNCTISAEPYPDMGPFYQSRINYIIDNAANDVSTADLSAVSSNWLYQLANDSANAAVNVSDLYVKYGKGQMENVLREAGSYKGNLYVATNGINKTNTYVELGLYYNMGWIEKLGVKDPAKMFNDGEWNYTGFKNWCLEVQALLNSEAGEYAIGGHAYYYWLGLTNAAGVKVADSIASQVNLDSQRSKDASLLMYQLVSSGAVDTNQTWAESDGGFIAGTTVMTTGSLWFVKNSKRWKDDMFGTDTRFGYVPFPYPDDLSKEDTRISQSSLSVLMYTAGRESKYPDGVVFEDVYYAVTELYLRTIKYQEEDIAFDAEQVVYDSLSKKIDNQESIDAIRWFNASRVFFDPCHSIYSSTADTVLKDPAINTMIKGNDYAQEFDSVRESYETLFKSKYA